MVKIFKNKLQKYQLRVYILFFFILLIASFITGKLYVVQILNADEYLAQAENQYIQRNYHLYDRGEIFFTTVDGELVSSATLKSGYVLAINPENISEPNQVLLELKRVVDISEDHFFNRYNRGKRYQEVLTGLNEEDAVGIRSLGLKGVSLHPQRWRFYPGGQTGAHVIGFVGYNDSEYGGQYGLERVYEDVLKRPDSAYRVNIFAELFADIVSGFTDSERSKESGDVITTIEPVVQLFLEQKLEDIEENWQSTSIGGIIMNPSTGAIRAMAVRPTFDSNHFAEVPSSLVFNNSLVNMVYEMGSVIKPLTIAAGLDAGVIEPDTVYYDSGRVQIENFVISNFDGKGNGEITMQDVLNKSVNTGVVYIMNKMGARVFADYMMSFGLDSKTGIDLPSESDNLVNFKSPRNIEYATASFGQGLALTPIGITRALAVLGNGGYVIHPYIVESIRSVDGEIIPLRTGEEERIKVLKKETSMKISRMLVNTVDEALLGGTASFSRHSVAAKTGTAQIPYQDKRGYREDAYLHSFFGYFPAYDPEFLIFLYHIEPQNAEYASQTLTPAFREIVSFLIQYYDIDPDR